MTLALRPATALDAGKTGEILYRFAADTQWMPVLYSEAEAIAFCGIMIERGWMTVAVRKQQIMGFLARDNEEICALYVAPGAYGQGIGKLLLDGAKAALLRLRLWTFQDNEGAQRFYLREGFSETGRGDGSNNIEGLPVTFYEWRAAQETPA